MFNIINYFHTFSLNTFNDPSILLVANIYLPEALKRAETAWFGAKGLTTP